VETHTLATLTNTLAQETQAMRKDAARPIIVLRATDRDELDILNVGKGAALDIELRLSQVHKTNKGFTNLRNFFERDDERHLLNIGDGSHQTIESDTLDHYSNPGGPDFQYGYPNVFVVIAIYKDIYNQAYYTIAAIALVISGISIEPVLKRTKTGLYTGELEALLPADWQL
jgi:hypothetical protein